MDRMLYVAMTGAKETLRAQAVNNHNLANASTTGFRADLAAFQSRAVDGSGFASRVYATNAHHRLGQDRRARCCRPAAISTSRSTATAGSRCRARTARKPTRAPAICRWIANGQLTTGTGQPVLGDGGPITVPPYTSIFFARDGSISIVAQGQTPGHHRRPWGASSWSIRPTTQLERGDDGLFRMKDGSDAPSDADRAARLGRARVEQRQYRRRHGQHDRAGAALRDAGQGDPHGGRERRRRGAAHASRLTNQEQLQ